MPSSKGSRAILFHRVEIGNRLTACRVADGRIAAVDPTLTPRPGELVMDGCGGALLPGLSDHHLHLWAMVAARTSVDAGGARDLAPIADQPGTGWLRVIGAGAEVDRRGLDTWWPSRPVRVQHRSGALWTLNSVAVDLVAAGLDEQERRTGQLWRADDRLRTLLAGLGPGSAASDADLAALGGELAALGITSVTDASPDLQRRSLTRLRAGLPQTVTSLGPDGGVGVPCKIVVADHDLPDLNELTARIVKAHHQGRPVALHVVSAVALVLTLAAFDTAGAVPGDRLEHAAVCDDRSADRIAALGITIVTQPSLWTRHGLRYRQDSPPHERHLLWRYAGLTARGVRVIASSDAPYGRVDPWATVHAAAGRILSDGSVGQPVECADPSDVVNGYLTPPNRPGDSSRSVTVGMPADLVLLGRDRAAAIARAAAAAENPVAATIIGGRLVYGSERADRSEQEAEHRAATGHLLDDQR